MLQQRVYDACCAHKFEEAYNLVHMVRPEKVSTEIGENLLEEVLFIHILLKEGRHDETLERAKMLYEITTNEFKFGSIVALLSIYWRMSDLDEYELLLEQGKELLTDNLTEIYPDWVWWYFTMEGVYLSSKGRLNDASTSHTKALNIAIKIEDPTAYRNSANNIAVVEIGRSNYQEARRIIEEVLESEFIDESLRFQFRLNLAVTLMSMEEFDEAISLHKELIEEVNEDSNSPYLINLYHNLAGIYVHTLEYELAEEYYMESLRIAEEQGYIKGVIMNYSSLGTVQKNIGNYSSATENYTVALDLAHADRDYEGVLLALVNMVSLDVIHGRFELALHRIEDILNIIDKEGGSMVVKSTALSNRALVYLQLGEKEKAELTLLKCKEIREEFDNSILLARVLTNLFLFYTEEERYEEARDVLGILDEISQKGPRSVKDAFTLCKAVSIKDIDASIQMLEDLVDRRLEDNYLALAMYTLMELYLQKLSQENDHEYFLKANRTAKTYLELVRRQRSIPRILDTLILLSKLSLIALNVVDARKYLDEALELSTIHAMEFHEKRVREEIELVAVGEWPNEVSDRIKYTKIMVFLKTKGGSKGSAPET